MVKLITLLAIISVIIFCTGCGVIFYDDFEKDVVGNAPSTSPPGGAPNDSLNLQGPPNIIVVINSAPLNSKAVKIERTSQLPQTALECVTDDGPHTSGKYSIRYKAYSGNVNAAPSLTATVKSSDGKRAFELILTGGDFKLSSGNGIQTLPIVYSANVVHSIEISIDMDSKNFGIDLNGTAAASGKPFLDPGFNDVRILRFEYPEPILESLPGYYVVDLIVIQK
jgi:hypothetical protein